MSNNSSSQENHKFSEGYGKNRKKIKNFTHFGPKMDIFKNENLLVIVVISNIGISTLFTQYLDKRSQFYEFKSNITESCAFHLEQLKAK